MDEPEGLVLAARDRRFVAVIVDAWLAWLALGAPYVVLLTVAPSLASPHQGRPVALGIGVLAMLALQIVQWALLSRWGQSLGKMLMGIKLVGPNGSNPGFGRAVALRQWLWLVLLLVPVVGAVLALVDLILITGRERRTLHDHLAGTHVVHAEGGLA